jgi:hypothetical protein
MNPGSLAPLLLFGLCLTVVGCQPEEPTAENNMMSLRLGLSSEKDSYDLDETIWVTVRLINEGDQSLTVNGRLLLNHASAPETVRDLYFEIVGPDGYSNRRLFRVNAGSPKESDLVELQPGDSHERAIELTRFHSLHLAGEYRITAHYLSATAIAGHEVWLGSLQSEPLVIERR